MWECCVNTKMLYGFKFSKYIMRTYYTNYFAMNSKMSEKKPLTSKNSNGRGRHRDN